MRTTLDIAIPYPWQKPLLVLGAALMLLIGLTAGSIASMIAVWQGATTYHHCFLVLPISLFLIWRKRMNLAQMAPRQEALPLLLLAGFALLWLVGYAGQIQLFQHIALVGMGISITLAVLGLAVGRMIAFPLIFLGFMVPFGDFLVPTLQQFTADFAVLLLRMIKIPVFHDGIMIETPTGLFEVAEACAGIRFLIANIMVATLFAHLAMGRLWKWAMFLALSAIVPIIANGFRATGIILIAYLTDNEYAAGVDHLVYGWGFFAAIMLIFLALGSWMADWPDDLPIPAPRSIIPDASPWHPAFALPLAALIAAAPVYAMTVLDHHPTGIGVDAKTALSPDLAKSLGPLCKAAGGNSDVWRPDFRKADFSRGLKLDCAGQSVDLFVAYYAQEREGRELIHYANRLADGEDWTRISTSWYDPKIEGLPSLLQKEELFGRRTGDRLVLAWYWIDGQLMARDWQVKAYQLYRKLLGKDEPAALVTLSATYRDNPDEALPGLAEVLKHHEGISDYLSELKTQP